MSKVVVPSIQEKGFSCPHCHVLTSQAWFSLRAVTLADVPSLHSHEFVAAIEADPIMDPPSKAGILPWLKDSASGKILVEKGESIWTEYSVTNLHLSQCYNCAKVAVWNHDRLIHPANRLNLIPNADLPSDIAADFEEASGIVNESPRGAAALLRLCVQKLCRHLGQSGKNIDDDIAALVRTGLNPLVQKSLDIVRVIGNEAVHPGTIDLNDNRDTALRLFEVVNAIADALITHPKSIESLYGKLPEAKRIAIEKRDKPSAKKS